MKESLAAGSSRNLTSRAVGALLAFSALALACSVEQSSETPGIPVEAVRSTAGAEVGERCRQIDLSPLKVVRIDDKQERFFAVAPRPSRDELISVVRKLEQCFSHTTWSEGWSLSVFSEQKLAGYKDESNIIPLHQGDQWAKGYLAEYDSSTRRLTLRPAVDPRVITIPPASDLTPQ